MKTSAFFIMLGIYIFLTGGFSIALWRLMQKKDDE